VVLKRTLNTLLLPRPGKSLILPGGDVVVNQDEYEADSTSVLASSVLVALFEHSYKATFILPLEHFDYDGMGKGQPNSAIVKGHDLIATLDESLQGKVRVDFMQPKKRDGNKKPQESMVAQLTFTRPKSATYFKLMLG
jgi:hypothetical protein